MKLPRGICRVCSQEFALRAAGGDWLNALYPRQHKDKSGQTCPGWSVETKILWEPLHETKPQAKETNKI